MIFHGGNIHLTFPYATLVVCSMLSYSINYRYSDLSTTLSPMDLEFPPEKNTITFELKLCKIMIKICNIYTKCQFIHNKTLVRN